MTTPTIARRCHWLRRNRASKRPDLLLFVDVESYLDPLTGQRDHHRFRLGWACLCRYAPGQGMNVIGWHKITDPLDFWHTVSRLAVEHKRVYIVSHNIDYDARILHAFSILPGIGWKPNYIILADSCKFFTFTADKCTIALLDNLNYWQISLEDLGQEFGLAKLKIDLETASNDELSTYCKRDVQVLVKVWRYWLQFLDDHDLGDWAITLSSQSWNAYRHRFMPCKIGIHNRADAIKLERDSYKGGRCEVWRVGKFIGGPFYKLDVNGLYAYAMRNYPSPRKLVKVLYNVRPEYLRKLLESYLVVADVLLETDQPYYAITQKGYNVFPTGTFQTTLTTWEIAHALDHGHIRAIGAVAIYEPAHLFTAFIDYFTPLRQQYKAAGDTGRSLLCKMIRNSLYGKFGQRGYNQKVIADAPLDLVQVTRWVDAETGETCADWTFGGKTIRQHYTGEGKDSFPAIASHIAAAGRCILWDYAEMAGLENVYYADTDSLIVNAKGYERLADWIDPLKLGYLKLEGQSADLEIVAKKSYRFGQERTLKGIKKSATHNPDGSWSQTQFTSLRWAFSHGNLDDVLTYDVRKQEHATLFHGRLSRNHQVVPPDLSLKYEQVAAIVAPESHHSWTWWIDPYFVQSLPSRKRDPILPTWYLLCLGDAANAQTTP